MSTAHSSRLARLLRGRRGETGELSLAEHREFSYRATVKLLEAAGILNTPNLSPTIVNIVQTNNNFFDSPMLSEIVDGLTGLVGSGRETEAIDYESED